MAVASLFCVLYFNLELCGDGEFVVDQGRDAEGFVGWAWGHGILLSHEHGERRGHVTLPRVRPESIANERRMGCMR